MAIERTLAIIKPDAVAAGNSGKIIAMIEAAGFKILAQRKERLSRGVAEGFYAVHQGKGFFAELVDFMTEGPVILMCLEREGAIAKWRELMGATNPEKAADGTVRKLFGANIGRNASHGSDAPETAAFELGWFFRGSELG